MNILLIEDNTLDAYLIDDIIKKVNKSYSVEVKADGNSALNYVNKLKTDGHSGYPNLIILDLVLPDISGFDVLKHIKSDDLLKKIPLVVFSASMSEEDKIRALSLGAVVYFRKPDNLSDYTEAVISFINLFSV